MRRILGLLLVGLGLALLLLSGWGLFRGEATPVAEHVQAVPSRTASAVQQVRVVSTRTAPETPVPTKPAERLVPTAAPEQTATVRSTVTPSDAPATATATLPATATPEATPSPTVGTTVDGSPVTASPSAAIVPALFTTRERIGVGVPLPPLDAYPHVDTLGLGWYLDWSARRDPVQVDGIEYVQMVRVTGATFRPALAELRAIAGANPGSLWLIGNEPDVIWQDNATPEQYATAYHDVYDAIKSTDTSARVAIGGVSQPTPLRLQYLDAILQAYRDLYGQEMPIDVWNIHNFILREERNSWGVDIPPGLSTDQGMLYGVDDADDLAIFRSQIIDFRRWMADRGYQNYPLIVSEYGIPMPEDYGFPSERVTAFIRNTFDFFLHARDESLGYPADGYRLVQRWSWYSLSDRVYPTGSLYHPETRELTPIGRGWQTFVEVELQREQQP